MRGMSYDDNFLNRKVHGGMQGMSMYDPMPGQYGTPMPSYGLPYYDTTNLDDDSKLTATEDTDVSNCDVRSTYMPSAKTKLILNRVALNQPKGLPPRPYGGRMGYPPPPPYYDYDYAYGGYGPQAGPPAGPQMYGGYRPQLPQSCGYGYGYPPPPPPLMRYRNFDPSAYMDDEYDPNYVPRYTRPARVSDALVEMEREKLCSSIKPTPTRHVTSKVRGLSSAPESDYMAKHFSPGMLQDQVDKVRHRLHNMTYALESSAPDYGYEKNRVDSSKKYASGPKHLSCVDYVGAVPQWKRRATTRYPSEDSENLSKISKLEINDSEKAAEKEPEKLILKDRLSMRIHNYFSDSLSPEKFGKYLKTYRTPGSHYEPLPTYTSKFSTKWGESSKWEEPGTVYSRDEIKPFSKTTDLAEEEEGKKEKRRKKKSKEREEEKLALESGESKPEVNGVAAASEEGHVEETEMDEKERKKVEKKRKKAEKEAAAKAAMEAELAALEEAEAELARLEAESTEVKCPQELVTETSVSQVVNSSAVSDTLPVTQDVPASDIVDVAPPPPTPETFPTPDLDTPVVENKTPSETETKAEETAEKCELKSPSFDVSLNPSSAFDPIILSSSRNIIENELVSQNVVHVSEESHKDAFGMHEKNKNELGNIEQVTDLKCEPGEFVASENITHEVTYDTEGIVHKTELKLGAVDSTERLVEASNEEIQGGETVGDNEQLEGIGSESHTLDVNGQIDESDTLLTTEIYEKDQDVEATKQNEVETYETDPSLIKTELKTSTNLAETEIETSKNVFKTEIESAKEIENIESTKKVINTIEPINHMKTLEGTFKQSDMGIGETPNIADQTEENNLKISEAEALKKCEKVQELEATAEPKDKETNEVLETEMNNTESSEISETVVEKLIDIANEELELTPNGIENGLSEDRHGQEYENVPLNTDEDVFAGRVD